MSDEIRFVPASTFSLDALAKIFTRAFEGYFYPGTTSAAVLALRTRLEQLDMHHSIVMQAGDEVAGIALLALRVDRAWCGGFGVTAPFRGQGLAHRLAGALLDTARAAGGRVCTLEVLTRNEHAIKTYQRAGLGITRDLRIMEWKRAIEGEQSAAADATDALAQHPPAVLLERFAVLHPVPAAWQRDLPALLVRDKLVGWALADEHAAYALISASPDGGARIEDLGAERAEHAAALLIALQARYPRLVSVNEPSDSPLVAAYDLAGFAEIDRQHEMRIELV
jgi:ribosomal protein S18 acetylase RimI-like enzyme